MASKKEKVIIKNLLEKIIIREDEIRFYFIKNSKVNKDLQHKIPFKTKKNASVKKIKSQQNKIQNDTGVDWEFIRWSDIIGGVLPESKVYKTPFFDTENIEIRNPWRVCPIGEHWVIRHDKHPKTGIITDHDGHCRKNPSKKDLLKSDEIDLIANSKLFLSPKVKVSKKDLKIKMVSLEKQNKYDAVISGWTAYWNHVFKLKNPLHPNYVKALMATESKFKHSAKAQNSVKIGPARGLLQLTERTTRLAKDYNVREYNDHFIDLEYEDLLDPNKNIALGVRHLFRKRETAKASLKREPTWFEVLMDYKGQLKSKTKEANRVREELKEYFKQMEMDI